MIIRTDQQTVTTYLVDPPVHVTDTWSNRTWRLIYRVEVTEQDGVDTQVTVLGHPATKTGERKGWGNYPVYGSQADAIGAEVLAMHVATTVTPEPVLFSEHDDKMSP